MGSELCFSKTTGSRVQLFHCGMGTFISHFCSYHVPSLHILEASFRKNDQRALQWLNSIVKTNSRHAKWALTLQQCKLVIVYVTGELQVADIVTVVGKQILLYIGFTYSKQTFTPRHADLHVAHLTDQGVSGL